MTIEIKRVSSLEDCVVLSGLAAAIWGGPSACSVPQLTVHIQYGGVALLAMDGHEPVGFLFSFPAKYHGEWVLWSHETGVIPAYLHRGIGYALKMEQRRIAADEGYDTIAWTFDPLVSRNGYFNLKKLHAAISEYKVNAYGTDETDLVNQGLETDRFIAVWPTQSDPVVDQKSEERLGQPANSGDDFRSRIAAERIQEPNQHVILRVGADGQALLNEQLLSTITNHETAVPDTSQKAGAAGRPVLTAVPADFGTVLQTSPRRAKDWRLRFREAAQALLQAEFSPVDIEVSEDKTRAEYIWMKTGGTSE